MSGAGSSRLESDADTNDRAGSYPAGDRFDGNDSEQVGPYVSSGGRVFKVSANKGRVPLANFDARILREELHDDGSGLVTRFLVLGGVTASGNPLPEVVVSATEFAGLNWVIEKFGAAAAIAGGYGAKEQLREAIQLFSGDCEQVNVYSHTGWRFIDGKWRYLHKGGAIGGSDPAYTRVSLGRRLALFELPQRPPGEARIASVRASLRVLEVAPDRATFPLYAFMLRAVLGGVDFGAFLVGVTGSGKSQVAALLQQHFGAQMDAEHLPGSWSSTANSLERAAFTAKDALFVVDDYVPQATGYANAELNRQVDRLFRALANQAGRGRLRADGSLAGDYFPRSGVLATGEDVPAGQSLRARMLICELGRGKDGLDWARLSDCQREAAAGRYAVMMSAYLKWLAPRYDEVIASFRARVDELLRQYVDAKGHRRTPMIIANLVAAFEVFLRFATRIGAVTPKRAAALADRLDVALAHAAESSARQIFSSDPVARFLALLREALISNDAFVSSATWRSPVGASAGVDAWGWRADGNDYRPTGKRIGFVDGSDLYLEPGVALGAAKAQAKRKGEEFAVTQRELLKRMFEAGEILSREEGRERFTVRRTIGRARLELLHVRADSVLQHDACAEPGEDAEWTAPDALFRWREGQIKKREAPSKRPGPHGLNGPSAKRDEADGDGTLITF